ncbi:MAG: beta strand repeat-containing protein, partial [Planctomycetota bacterium]
MARPAGALLGSHDSVGPELTQAEWEASDSHLLTIDGGATGDILVGNSGGYAVRLAIGSTNQLLAVTGGTLAYTSSPTIPGNLSVTGTLGVTGATTLAGGSATSFDVITGATTSSSFHIGEAAGEGGFFDSVADYSLNIAAGAEMVSGSWTARSTAATIIQMANGTFSVWGDTGLTDGNTFSPSDRIVMLNSGDIGINTQTPSYLLDVNGTFGVTGAATFSSTLSCTTLTSSAGLAITGNSSVAGDLTITTGSLDPQGEGNTGALTCIVGDGAGLNNAGNSVTALGYQAAASNSFASVMCLGSGATATATNQCVIGGSSVYYDNFYLGSGVSATTPQNVTLNVTLNATGSSGANDGADLILASGTSVSGSTGDVIIKTGTTTAMTVSGDDVTFADDITVTDKVTCVNVQASNLGDIFNDSGVYFSTNNFIARVNDISFLAFTDAAQDLLQIGATSGDIDIKCNSNALFVEGSTGAVGIGTGAPTAGTNLHILSTSGSALIELDDNSLSSSLLRSNSSGTSHFFDIDIDHATYDSIVSVNRITNTSGDSEFRIYPGNGSSAEYVSFDSDANGDLTIVPSGGDANITGDLRVSSEIFATSHIGIGVSSTDYPLEISGVWGGTQGIARFYGDGAGYARLLIDTATGE